jgi:hypothetical protein
MVAQYKEKGSKQHKPLNGSSEKQMRGFLLLETDGFSLSLSLSQSEE